MRAAIKIERPEGGGWDRHHVWGGPYRKASERWGCVAYLPHEYHLCRGPHSDRRAADELKGRYQAMLEQAGWTREEFMETFGRNYL